MLIFTPFSLASYHGESSSGETSTGGSSSGGYGGGGGAIAGILLVVGLVYFLNRDTDTDEVANELLSQNTKKLKKFEFNFVTNEMLPAKFSRINLLTLFRSFSSQLRKFSNSFSS